MDELLNTAPCGFLSFSDDGTILLVNNRLVDVLETTKEELEGQHIETIFSVGARVFYHTHFFPLLKMQGTAEEIYFSLRSKGGADVPVLVNAARHERDGRTVNDCIFVRMRQRREGEISVDDVARSADTAAGDLRLRRSRAARAPSRQEGLRGYLDAVKSAGREMLRLINDILGFAQLESGHVEVRPSVVRVNESCVTADPDRLQQILLNLLTNAAKFTPARGNVRLSCEQAGATVRMHVADTGVGIPSDQIARIFEPFAQVDAAAAFAQQQGVGLGLAISRELARAMGGELSVVSEPGKGSTFTLTLAASS